MHHSSQPPHDASGRLTIADLLRMPHLGLQLVAGRGGASNAVLWTHVSELAEPGPWLEGGELLIVNGFGMPHDAPGQLAYLSGLVQHRLSGLAVSIHAPELTPEFLDEADREAFPVLRIPRRIPFIEISYLVANASEKSSRSRLSRHLRILDTLKLRNTVDNDVAQIYRQLEDASGYRLALVTPAGLPLLDEWPWVPEGLRFEHSDDARDLQVIQDGFVLPLFVGERVTAYLVGTESEGVVPAGLAALQHVSSLAALDAVDDQRRREAVHRQGSALLAGALEAPGEAGDVVGRLRAFGLPPEEGWRVLALGLPPAGGGVSDIDVRNWFADRRIPHLLLQRERLLALVGGERTDVEALLEGLGVDVGVSAVTRDPGDLGRVRSQAQWALGVARESAGPGAVFADRQVGLSRWLNPDAETLRQLSDGVLRPLVEHDQSSGSELVVTLVAYFNHQGSIKKASAALFVHEHTLSYRLKRIEQLTGRRLKSFRDAFELWLAVELGSLADDQ